MDKIYDMLVIGGGPAGCTAALYAARAGRSVVIMEQISAGGQMALAEQIDNYPGFPNGIDGFSLGEAMQQGAERFGAQTVVAEVIRLDLAAPVKRVTTTEGEFLAKTVVLATGAMHRTLGLPGEPELLGKGVAYCASCEGMFYRGKTVAVVGGGNTAAGAAMLLSNIAARVIVIHRRDTLRADRVYADKLKKQENVEFCWNSRVTELLYGDRLTGLQIEDVRTGNVSTIACDGVFVCTGRQPVSSLVEKELELDAAGYVVADETTRTAIPGVFAAGDVRTKAVRQIVTAVADGAAAAHFAEEYLGKL